MSPPLLSIGLPVYNGERYLRLALESIVSQDYADWELVICDNASTDSTAAICREYAAQDSRIRYHRNPENIGAAPNHNRVFRMSRGKYFSWAAHDVICLPGMLRTCMETILAAPPSVVLVYPRCDMVDESGALPDLDVYTVDVRDPVPHRRLAAVIQRLTWVNQLRGVIVSDALRRTRLLDSFPSSDYVLLAELALLGELWELPTVLVRRYLEPKTTAGKPWATRVWTGWLDPRKQNHRHRFSAREHLAAEFIRSGWRIPSRPSEKILGAVIAGSAFYRRVLLRKFGLWRSQVDAFAWKPRLAPGSGTE